MSIVRALGFVFFACYALAQQACMLNPRSDMGRMWATYERMLENRAIQQYRQRDSYLRDVASVDNAWAQDTVLRDGLPGTAGDDAEERNLRRIKHEVAAVGRKALADTVKELWNGEGGKQIAQVLTPNPVLENTPTDIGPTDGLEAPQAYARKSSFSGRLVSPKIQPGARHARVGVDVLHVASAKFGWDYADGKEFLELKLRWSVWDDVLLTGHWKRDFEDDERKCGGGLFWKGWGAWYTENPDGSREVWGGWSSGP